MNKEELFKAIDEKIKQKFGCYIWTKEVNELVELAQRYADSQTSELKAEIERLKSELADVKQCLVFTISCITPADFEEMKYKAKKLLNIN